ncbi:MAG: RDD family protein [Chloroflexota bacterium]|nr:RDD family protein [Chloroflexota bacterium]MDE2886227.1 RDD family protein [Chloroflexota bacterium]
MEYAGPLQRLAAFIVDAVVISVVIGVLDAVGLIDLGDPTTTDQALEAVISFGYFILLTAAFGATLGKMALGMRVVEEGGQKAGFFRVLIRETIGKIVSAIVFLLGFIWILFDGKRQGWHDKIGGTFVVKAR